MTIGPDDKPIIDLVQTLSTNSALVHIFRSPVAPLSLCGEYKEPHDPAHPRRSAPVDPSVVPGICQPCLADYRRAISLTTSPSEVRVKTCTNEAHGEPVVDRNPTRVTSKSTYHHLLCRVCGGSKGIRRIVKGSKA